MKRILTSALVLTLVILTVALAVSVAAKPNRPPTKKPPHARVTWSVPRIEQTLAPGTTIRLQVTMVSSADLSDVTLRVPGGLGRVLTVEPTSIASVKAGVVTPVTLTVSMPLARAHSQGGVVQVRAGNPAVPSPLKVKIRVPGTENEADNDVEEDDADDD